VTGFPISGLSSQLWPLDDRGPVSALDTGPSHRRAIRSEGRRFFMNPYWIRTERVRLAITPRPRGEDWLADDIRFLQRAGLDVLVSALTLAEAEELRLLEESQCCQNNGLEFLSFPIEDRSVPASFSEFDGLLKSITEFLRNCKAAGVHCRAGIGRSSMIVASALIQNGLSVDSAFRFDSRIEGLFSAGHTRTEAMGGTLFVSLWPFGRVEISVTTSSRSPARRQCDFVRL